MSRQGKVDMTGGSPLGLMSNAATVMVDEPAGSPVDGKVIYPLEVRTQRLVVAEALYVDNESIILGDGVVYARNLVQTDVIIANSAQIGGAVIGAGHISVPSLSVISAHLGTIETGDIFISDGGVSISNDGGVSGMYFGANEIYSKVAGVKTVDWDGLTGIISATKFILKTAASGSRLEIDSDSGAVAYDAGDVARTALDENGITITSSDPTDVAQCEKATFRASGCESEGSIYMLRAVRTLTRTVVG